ncbi:MAG: GyrI-like domain-containing protein, partial [Flavisolibacter sp.]
LAKKTTNANGQSAIDCGQLWQRFEKENCIQRIDNKIDDSIYAVYFDYEEDHTKPFSYFIGCKVSSDSQAVEGMSVLQIPTDNYIKLLAKGKMPDCIANCWKDIWTSGIARAYHYDFEVYDERSKNWNDAEVDVYVSSK